MYETQNFDHLIGLEGFSEKALQTHFKLYSGYVTNTNKVSDILKEMINQGQETSYEFAELKRRNGWEYSGMRLHELFFGNISKQNNELDSSLPLYKKIVEEFGSYANWEKDFRATASMRGIGWVILYFDENSRRLFNVWINEHDVGHLPNCKPLLVLDVFEHAFMLDYNTNKPDYLNSFFKAIDWEVVSKRF